MHLQSVLLFQLKAVRHTLSIRVDDDQKLASSYCSKGHILVNLFPINFSFSMQMFTHKLSNILLWLHLSTLNKKATTGRSVGTRGIFAGVHTRSSVTGAAVLFIVALVPGPGHVSP